MNIFSRSFFRIFVIFAIILFAMQPYNWYCKISSKCQGLNLSMLIPAFEGNEPIVVNFAVTNFREGLEIFPQTTQITTVSGRKNKVKYTVKNKSGKFMRFRTVFETDPSNIEPHIKKHQCLCHQRYKLKKDEELTLTASFSLDQEAISLMKKRDDKKELTIIYRVK